MKRILVCISFAALVLSLLPSSRGRAQSAADKTAIKIIYSALTASNAPVWVGGDQNLYEKYGLAVEVIHGRGASPIQALAGGAVQLGHFAGAAVISANLGGSDLVFVAAQSNYVVLSIWTRRDSHIKSLADLAGKNIGGKTGYRCRFADKAPAHTAGCCPRRVSFFRQRVGRSALCEGGIGAGDPGLPAERAGQRHHAGKIHRQ